MSDEKETRERIRALVRDVLANAVTIDEPPIDALPPLGETVRVEVPPPLAKDPNAN